MNIKHFGHYALPYIIAIMVILVAGCIIVKQHQIITDYREQLPAAAQEALNRCLRGGARYCSVEYDNTGWLDVTSPAE